MKKKLSRVVISLILFLTPTFIFCQSPHNLWTASSFALFTSVVPYGNTGATSVTGGINNEIDSCNSFFSDTIIETKRSLNQIVAFLRPTPWIVGVGWNIVDDDGNPWKKVFETGKSWNIPPYPSSIRVEKYIHKGWSFVFGFAYNKYKPAKLINNEIIGYSSNFMSFDLNAKYNFCDLYDFNTKWFKLKKKIFDIYATSGLGYTHRSTPKVKGAGTYNIGFGTNIWAYKSWGINLQALAKFGLSGTLFKTPANYLQYTFGTVYIFKLGSNNLGKRHKDHKVHSINGKL